MASDDPSMAPHKDGNGAQKIGLASTPTFNTPSSTSYTSTNSHHVAVNHSHAVAPNLMQTAEANPAPLLNYSPHVNQAPQADEGLLLSPAPLPRRLRDPGPSNLHPLTAFPYVGDRDMDKSHSSWLGGSSALNQACLASPEHRNRALSPARSQLVARKSSNGSLHCVLSRSPSVKLALANNFASGSPGSAYPSPVISAMADVTPLPSPLLLGDSPGPWRQMSEPSDSPPPLPIVSKTSNSSVTPETPAPPAAVADANTCNGDKPDRDPASKRKALAQIATDSHAQPATIASANRPALARPPAHCRKRSTSEYVPDPRLIPQRHPTIGSKLEPKPPARPHMRREPYLSESRGIIPTISTVTVKPPTPPPSERDSPCRQSISQPSVEYYDAHGDQDKTVRRWRYVRFLGQGTFSKVMLATSNLNGPEEFDFPLKTGTAARYGTLTPTSESNLDRKSLVAVKICEHGPRGGASEDRIEMSLKRELDILRSVHHPSLVNLKAWNVEPTRALLVLSYCPGGDLFDLASESSSLLTPPLLRRIFSECVAAVQYLHGLKIVHRDIKLENVLVNLTPAELADPTACWAAYPYAIITVADLGLSRRIHDGEQLNTRCGSEDYAAPEVILGQGYDGRATDAWSLGVLLYALLEGRLPFDPNPNMPEHHRMRSRTTHRIARVDWQWVKYGGEDGDHDASVTKFKQMNLEGAMEITEALLKRARSRITLNQVAEHEWVKGGIQVPGGLRFREEEEGEAIGLEPCTPMI